MSWRMWNSKETVMQSLVKPISEVRFSTRGVVDAEVRRGFTLVELLVVVSVIALLISILLPSLRSARDQAKSIKCLAHMRGVGQAAMMFSSEHDGRVQLVASEGNLNAADESRMRFSYGEGQELLAWPTALAQLTATGYTNNWDWGVRAKDYEDAKEAEKLIDDGLDLFTCPADRVQLSSAFFPRHQPNMYGEGLVGNGDPENPRSPVNRMSYWGRLSYGINEDVAGGDGADYDYWPSCWRAVRSKSGGWTECVGGKMYGPSSECFRSNGSRLRGSLEKVFDPAQVGLFFETGPESIEQALDPNYGSQYANLINSTGRQEYPELNGPFLGNAQQSHPWRIPTNRHPDGKLNVAYTDGHGETVRAKEYKTNSEVNRDLPSKYSPRVRVSPYNHYGLGL